MGRTIRADVAVFGGGPAGIGAALAAARAGAKTILVEKLGSLGGQMTNGMVTSLHGFRTHIKGSGAGSAGAYLAVDHKTRLVLGGIPVEIVSRLRERGATVLKGEGPAMRTEFDPELMKPLLFEMMEEAGVELLMDSFAFGTVMDSERIKAVRVANKNGEELIEAGQFIDATADGDISAWAGAPFEIGQAEDGRCMSVTLYMKLGGTDLQKVLDYLKENPAELHNGTAAGWQQVYDSNGPLTLTGYPSLIRKAFENGDYPAIMGSKYEPPYPIFSVCNSYLPKGQTHLLADMAYGINCADAADLSRAEVHLRMVQAPAVMRFVKKYLPGFENSYLMETASLIGTRESRRITGEYVLTEEDVLGNRRFPDAVARCGRAMNVHSVTGGRPGEERGGQKWVEPENPQGFDIPLRCLIPQKVKNLFTSGRCISVTHMALGSVRGMPVCTATGEAAGTAAALCCIGRVEPGMLDVGKLQEALRANNVVLE